MTESQIRKGFEMALPGLQGVPNNTKGYQGKYADDRVEAAWQGYREMANVMNVLQSRIGFERVITPAMRQQFVESAGVGAMTDSQIIRLIRAAIAVMIGTRE